MTVTIHLEMGDNISQQLEFLSNNNEVLNLENIIIPLPNDKVLDLYIEDGLYLHNGSIKTKMSYNEIEQYILDNI